MWKKVTPKATTLAQDYRCPAVPDSPRDLYRGHSAGVKCVAFVGEEALLLASGSADGEVSIWPTNPLALSSSHLCEDQSEAGDSSEDCAIGGLRRSTSRRSSRRSSNSIRSGCAENGWVRCNQAPLEDGNRQRRFNGDGGCRSDGEEREEGGGGCATNALRDCDDDRAVAPLFTFRATSGKEKVCVRPRPGRRAGGAYS